jgi:hypothetical protein
MTVYMIFKVGKRFRYAPSFNYLCCCLFLFSFFLSCATFVDMFSCSYHIQRLSSNSTTIDSWVWNPGPSQAGGPGGHVPSHFLADQLTLSQPGGAHYPHTVLCAPPDFQTLRRPWNLSSP